MSQVQGRRTVAAALIVVAALSIFLVELLPVHASGATLVQQNNAGCQFCASATVQVLLSNPVSSGDVIVVGIYAVWGTVSVTDSLGSSYSHALTSTDGTDVVSIYYALSSGGASDMVSVTVQYSGSPENAYVYDVSGVAAAGASWSGDAGSNNPAISAESVSFLSGAFLLGIIGITNDGTGSSMVTPGNGFSLSTDNSGAGFSHAQYAASGVSSPTNFPATLTNGDSNGYFWAEAGIALEPSCCVAVNTASPTSVTSTTFTTSSASTTSGSSQTSVSSTTTTTTESTSITNTLLTTSTTTGSLASTSTTTFTSPLSTSYSTSSSTSSGQVVWSANFETGDNSQFQWITSTCQNGVIGVSSLNPPTNGAIVHSGNYAGYYSGGTPTDSSASSCREVAGYEVPNSEALTDFYFEMWVYEPAFTLGLGWQSFATFCSSAPGVCQPFTLDENKEGYLQVGVVSTGQYYPENTQLVPVGSWFKLSFIAHGVGTSDASLVVSMNDQALINVSGVSISPDPIVAWHFGLYKDSTVGTMSVYNDDILIEALSSETETGTTTTSTVQSETTTSTGTMLYTTTAEGTITVSETDTFNVLLTQIFRALGQFEAFILQTLGFQVTATPVGQQVNQVIVTVTTPTASTTSLTTVESFTTTTSSTSITKQFSTVAGSATTMFSQPPLITKILTTTTFTFGSVAGTSTIIFTSPLVTSYSTTTTSTGSSQAITQTDVTTASTVSSETTTSTGTVLSTATTGSTATISETDTFNVLLTTIFQELHQFADNILQFLSFQVTATPVGQQVNEVIVTTTSTAPGQVTMTVSYSVVGSGAPTAPVFHYVLKGASKSLTLTKTPTKVSADSSSTWSITPNPLTGSTSTQRWYSAQALTGKASGTTIVFTFQHQYLLTMKANGPGTVSPSSGTWYNAGTKVTITATPNSGHKFKSWTGSGTGSYTGTKNPTTITMNAAITETANFA